MNEESETAAQHRFLKLAVDADGYTSNWQSSWTLHFSADVPLIAQLCSSPLCVFFRLTPRPWAWAKPQQLQARQELWAVTTHLSTRVII